MDIETQKGVPIPPIKRARRPKYPFETMEVGAMFFVPGKPRGRLVTYVSTMAKKLGRKFTTRHLHMRETVEGFVVAEAGERGAVEGVGVWRDE